MIPVWTAIGGAVLGSAVTIAVLIRSAQKAEKWENRH